MQKKCSQLENDLENERALKDGVLSQLDKSHHENHSLQKEVDEAIEDNELMSQELEDRFMKINKQQKTLDELEEQNNELAKQNDNLQNQNEFNNDMVQRARQRIRQLCAAAKQNEKLTKSEPNLASIGTEPDEEDKLKSSDTLDSGIFDDVIGDVMDLTQHHDELNQKMRHYEALRDENDQLKAEYAQLLNQNGNLKKQNSDLQDQLDEIDRAFEETSVENQSEISETSNPVAKIVLLKKANDELNQSLHQSRLEDQESTNNMLELLKDENERVMEENQGLKEALETSKIIDDYKSQPDSLEKRLSVLEDENSDLQAENSQLQDEIESLNKKLKREPYEETIDNQKGLKEGALAEAKRLQLENAELQDKIEVLEKNTPEQQKRLQDGIMSELKRKEQEVLDLQDENQRLSERIARSFM